MKPSRILIALALVLTSLTLGQAADVTLTDGRVLRNATICSQTPLTVTIKHAAGLCSVSKKLLPPELAARYPPDEAAARENALKAEQARAKAQALESAEAERVAREHARSEASAAVMASQPVRQAAEAKTKYESVRADAQARAEAYFNTEYEPVTQARNISSVRVSILECRLVEGWNNRWFVRGKCDVQSYEIVKIYPYYLPHEIQENSRLGQPLDYTPVDTPQYTTQTRIFEADYSTENGDPTFDLTLR